MTVLLLGATSQALPGLDRLGLEYDLVAPPEEMSKLKGIAPIGLRTIFEHPLNDIDALSTSQISLSRYSAVLSFTELGISPAASLNAMLGRLDTGLRASYLVRNKAAGRERLAASGLTALRYGFGTPDPGLDVVAKPIGGMSSVGIRALRAAEAASLGPGLYWEEYAPGPEVSVEAVTWNGEHQILGVTAKVTTGWPRHVEVAHLFPAPLSPADETRVHDYTRSVLSALDIRHGASHTELRLVGENRRPEFVESHVRPGGDQIPQIVEAVTGIDQYELAAASSLGTRPSPRTSSGTLSGVVGVSMFGFGTTTARALLTESGAAFDAWSIVGERSYSGTGEGSFSRPTQLSLVSGRPEVGQALVDFLERRFVDE